MDTLQETYRLLEERRASETLEQIARGADVNYHWLNKFVQRKMAEPGYLKVQRLHQYLSQQQNVNAA